MKKKLIKFICAFILALAVVLPVGGFVSTPLTPVKQAHAIILGPWVYQFADATSASKKIPKSLKSGDMKVNLGKFKDKYGNTPKTKNSGSFKNGDWHIEKDNAGHLGYDGSVKKWKLYHGKGRVASLNKYGDVVDK